MSTLASLLFAVTFISGVSPELHTFNREGECGTGAVVPWAGSLWYLSYAPHMPCGSSDLLYELKPDFSRVIHRDVSLGGTPANRMIHAESKQLFIGPYAIGETGKVRAMPPVLADGTTNLYGRLTATARHLTDPAKKVYMATMEEGLYEVDVDTLKVTELFRDGNIQGYGRHDGALLPGYHGKGCYTGQGRLVYANNGEFSPAAMKDPTVPSGCLAQWNGKPGTNSWQVVLRNQFTDITSKGGISGAADPAKDPLWAIGWDFRSVILMVLEDGAWHRYRLPKGSHSYDGAHGWNTEWPRIREIGEGDDYLMTMHGTFWHFPATMSVRNSAGIRPRSNYLKVVGDFCRWNGKVVLGCDDTAGNEFLNKRKAKGKMGSPSQSNSSLWFVEPKALDGFGPAIGRGAVWMNDDVAAGERSDPYLLAGYGRRMLYAVGGLLADIEIDEKGDGNWKKAGVLRSRVTDLSKYKGEWIRLVARRAARNVTAAFVFADYDRRPYGTATTTDVVGILRSGKGDEALPLNFSTGAAYYEMLPGKNGLELKKSADAAAKADLEKWFKMDPKEDLGDSSDAASAIVTDDEGRRWRFPRATEAARPGRLCRECCTERDLLNLAGILYELPAENAGGFAKIRAISTPGAWAYDYCTWRGLFVISGLIPEAKVGTVVTSDDGQAKLWAGAADDLWAFGKPTGKGGPWKDTAVKAGVPSDPFLLCGFNRKTVTVSAEADANVRFEIDITGTGTWLEVAECDLKAGAVQTMDFSEFNAYWVRTTCDRDCKATVQFEYN